MLLNFLISISIFTILDLVAGWTTTTSVVSVYSTTTISANADHSASTGDCNNFVGACVVFGGGRGGAAPYTTTVYVGSPSPPSPPSSVPNPPSTATVFATFTTTTIPTTVTAASTGGCGDFSGACVVYGSNTGGAYSTTVYAGSGNGHGGEGNSHGFIGQGDNSGDGQIGGARSLRCDMWTMGSVVALFALAFAVMIGL